MGPGHASSRETFVTLRPDMPWQTDERHDLTSPCSIVQTTLQRLQHEQNCASRIVVCSKNTNILHLYYRWLMRLPRTCTHTDHQQCVARPRAISQSY